jgi:hypothetical protein
MLDGIYSQAYFDPEAVARKHSTSSSVSLSNAPSLDLHLVSFDKYFALQSPSSTIDRVRMEAVSSHQIVLRSLRIRHILQEGATGVGR